MLSLFNHIKTHIRCMFYESRYKSSVQAWSKKLNGITDDFIAEAQDLFEAYALIDGHAGIDTEKSPYSNADYQKAILELKHKYDVTLQSFRNYVRTIMNEAFADVLHDKIFKEFYQHEMQDYQRLFNADILMYQLFIDAEFAKYQGKTKIQIDVSLTDGVVTNTTTIE